MLLGMGPQTAVCYLANALELRYRLPKLWARVVNGQVAVWKAFRIAERSHGLRLSLAGAAWVDTKLAPFAHSCSFAQIERTLAEALVTFDSDQATARAKAAAERRCFEVDLGESETLTGTVTVHGVLDLADALDLDATVTAVAAQLADLGSTETLNVRRSQAVGEIARAQATLDLTTGELDETRGRGVTIYAHVGETGAARIEDGQTPVLLDQLLAWCTRPGTTVTIKPVIDLAATTTSTGYQPSETLREQVVLRDETCVFPHCHRRRVDLDHNQPWNPDAPDDPEAGGQTTSDNLGCLCRTHHRAKTRRRWAYDILEPGLFHWTSPTGATYLVDRRGSP